MEGSDSEASETDEEGAEDAAPQKRQVHSGSIFAAAILQLSMTPLKHVSDCEHC